MFARLPISRANWEVRQPNPSKVRGIFQFPVAGDCAGLSRIVTLRHHRLDIHDRRSVDRFYWADFQFAVADFANGYAMQAQRIGPVGRAGGEHAGQRAIFVAAWMDLQNIAMGFVEPRDEDDFVAGSDAKQRVRESRIDFKPRVGAPSRPCLGALCRSTRGERITPIG